MENDEEVEPRWPIDLEETVARNVRRLREGRGISQQQLGNDLTLHGVGMHQTTVAKLEAGSKPLRLNEIAAIAAYFEVPVESLWEKSGEILNEHEIAVLTRDVELAERDLAKARAYRDEAVQRADEARQSSAEADAHAAAAEHVAIAASRRGDVLGFRLRQLKQGRSPSPGVAHVLAEGQSDAQATMEDLGHGEH